MNENAQWNLKKRPRTKKGWQEWNRRYALGFLYGQIDRVVSSERKKNQIEFLFLDWEKRFRSECTIEKPDDSVGNKHDLIEDQIDFIAQYIACSILDGTGKENLDRLKYFLSMQGSQNTDERMELRFLGGSPIEAYAFVDSIDDIDVADVVFITNCDTMFVYREEMKPWTEKTHKSFLEKLRKDIMFDMPNSDAITCSPVDSVGETGLEIFPEVDEDDLNMQMFRCIPPSLRKQFD